MGVSKATTVPGVERPAAGLLTNRYLFYVLAGVSQLMFAVDSSIMTVALRTLVVDLDTTLALAGWALTGYALTQTVAMPVVGKLGEQFGEMRVFVLSVVVFITGSLLCGIATNVYMLIACRVLQAIGGGGIMPSAISIIARVFPESRARMLGLFTSIFPIGGIIGPNIGGLLLEHFSWRVLFLVNVPVGLIVVPLLAREIASYDRATTAAPGRKRRLDVVGAGLFAGAMVALLLALTFVAQDPSIVRTPTLWLTVLACIVLFALFGWQERRVAEPVIDLDLVIRHPFSIVNIHNLLFGACVWGSFAFVPYYAVVQYGMSPFESGAILTPRSITAIVLGTVTSFLMYRLGYRVPIVVGLALISIANVALGQGWAGDELGFLTIVPFALMALVVGLQGIGSGLVMPASNNAALDLLPDRAGVISGMRGVFRSTGGILGTAVIVVILSLSEDQAAGLRMAFTVYGVVLLAAIPLTLMIPEMPREERGGEDHSSGARQTAPAEASCGVPASTP
jgi:EmrB/QacA subfamily drug resistance transporter